MADVETITDPAVALDRCGDLFRSDPVGSNLVAAGLSPAVEAELLRAHDGAATVGVALVVGDTCVLAAPTDDAVTAFGASLSIDRPLHLSGPAGPVAELAGCLSERSDGAVIAPQLSRMYRADQVEVASKRRRGKAFVSDRSRIEQAAQWGVDFGRDTGLERSIDESAAQMERAVNERRLIEWRSKGEVVSQMVISAARFGVVRIGLVYTPREHRQKGHGAAFVAAVSQQQLERQKVDTVILDTASGRASANRMYRGLGFVPAFEMLGVRVVPGRSTST